MPKLFISDLNSKDECESIFLVKIINVMEGKDGKKYFNIILTDSSGEMEARLWQYKPEVEREISKGSFVKARGKLNLSGPQAVYYFKS